MSNAETKPDWCDVCKAPQMVMPDGEHHCGGPKPAPDVEALKFELWVICNEVELTKEQRFRAFAAKLQTFLREREAALQRIIEQQNKERDAINEENLRNYDALLTELSNRAATEG